MKAKFTVDKSWFYEGVEMWSDPIVARFYNEYHMEIFCAEDVLDFHAWIVKERKEYDMALERVLKHVFASHSCGGQVFNRFEEIEKVYNLLLEMQDYTEVAYADMPEEQRRLVDNLF